MKLLQFLLLICWWQVGTRAQKCTSPVISKRSLFIYRTVPPSKVEIISCFYTDGNKLNDYYDITTNCVNAAQTNIFIDKHGDDHTVGDKVTLTRYYADADTSQNVIQLRSGKKCRYDAGFCFDSSAGPNYAVVWRVNPVPQRRCSNQMQQIFHGFAEFWTFTKENRHYIFYSIPLRDQSFALSLSNSSICNGEQAWYADEQGFLVSFNSLLPGHQTTPRLDANIFPAFRTKGEISDNVIRDCTLKSYSLNFDTKIDVDYLGNAENLKVILKFYQQNIDNNRNEIIKLTRDIKNRSANPTKSTSTNELIELNRIKTSLSKNLNDITKLFDEINKLNSNDAIISSKIMNLANSVTQLQNYIKTVEISNKNLQTLFTNLQNDVNGKILNFDINFNRKIKTELDKLGHKSELDILGKLNPVLQSLNQSSTTCLTNIASLKTSTDNTIRNLQNNLKNKESAVDKSITDKLQNDLNALQTTFNTTVSKLERNNTICLNNVASLKQNTDNSIRKLQNDLKNTEASLEDTIRTEYKNDLNSFKNTFRNTVATLENNNTVCLNNVDTLKQNTENSIRKLQNDLKNTEAALESSIRNKFQNDLNTFKNTFQNSVGTLEQNLQNCLANQKATTDELKTTKDTVAGLKKEIDDFKKQLRAFLPVQPEIQ